LEHFGLFETILGPFWIVQYRFVLFQDDWMISFRLGPLGAISIMLDYAGPFWPVLNLIRLFCMVSDDFGPCQII
jgi:hypothetical protein